MSEAGEKRPPAETRIEQKDSGRLVELSFTQMMDLWVAQDADRYRQLLVDRGYLTENDKNDPVALAAADREWRLTYVRDLGLEGARWVTEDIEDARQRVADWLLGGWPGWLPYRPQGAAVTHFADVANALARGDACVPERHQKYLPDLAANITDVLAKSEIILLRCGESVAVLDGTHRMASYLYALQQGKSIPATLRVYACDLPMERREVFGRFCENRPIVMGKYHRESAR